MTDFIISILLIGITGIVLGLISRGILTDEEWESGKE
jgi:hypothetical protein